MTSINKLTLVRVMFTAGAIAASTSSAIAANLCVRPSGGGGCYKTISAAVAAAAPNDVIHVGHGTYHEDVVIDKALSLIGDDDPVVIDATGLLNGINVSSVRRCQRTSRPAKASTAAKRFT